MIEKRYKILIYLSLAISLFALSRTFLWFPVVRIRNEKNSAYAAATAKYMRNCLVELVREGNSVHFVFNNDNYGVVEKFIPYPKHPDIIYENWTSDFILQPGEFFRGKPDHHRTSRYTLTEIEPTGIKISYETRFDHRSLGKNLVNVNRGQLRLPWKEKKN